MGICQIPSLQWIDIQWSNDISEPLTSCPPGQNLITNASHRQNVTWAVATNNLKPQPKKKQQHAVGRWSLDRASPYMYITLLRIYTWFIHPLRYWSVSNDFSSPCSTAPTPKRAPRKVTSPVTAVSLRTGLRATVFFTGYVYIHMNVLHIYIYSILYWYIYIYIKYILYIHIIYVYIV